MQKQKRVAAVHDISCFGRCSLTVALPIISSAGIETSVIPTAILSTHTGGFTGYTYRDLTEDLLPIAGHWQSLGLTFDAVYTGYLGSIRQIGLIAELYDRLKTPGTLFIVDPVMADNGRLYASFSESFPGEMKKLCEKADIIVPNVTEACLLLGRPFRPGPYSEAFIRELLDGLAGLGPGRVVLTGVSLDGTNLGAASLDTGANATAYACAPMIEGFYPGTGDVFASVLVAALLSQHDLTTACQLAVDFTAESIARTKAAGTDVRWGVCFEAGLKDLAIRLT
jgi:pyridoxine kinase